MPCYVDGPISSLFTPLPLAGNVTLATLAEAGVSAEMRARLHEAPEGSCVGWGIPLAIDRQVLIAETPVTCELAPVTAPWLVFMHTSDFRPCRDAQGVPLRPISGMGRLAEHAADYVFHYVDGTALRVPIRRRFEVGLVTPFFGEHCFAATHAFKPHPRRPAYEQPGADWLGGEARVTQAGPAGWTAWLWAWENPRPEVPLTGIRFEPVSGAVLISALAAGYTASFPLRWETRRKAIFPLPEGVAFDPTLDAQGRLAHLQLDLGQVISAVPRRRYPTDGWTTSSVHTLPELDARELLVEYTAHPEARFHFPALDLPPYPLPEAADDGPLRAIAPATQRVRLRAVEPGTATPLPVRLHVHGPAGEYLSPLDRHRFPNPQMCEDQGAEYVAQQRHACAYLAGDTLIDLPLGEVYVELWQGFERRPQRRVVTITPETRELTLPFPRTLDWRARGWVAADTHVHGISPSAALLQGAGEGVQVVSLLAAQIGEYFLNAGDFDGATNWSAPALTGGAECVARVGTENRSAVLGHISLIGYHGQPILPINSGGPLDSVLGEPVDGLLTEWARQCRAQDGLVLLSHFPYPRAEVAATLVSGLVDAVEVSLGGIANLYQLADWYRYLNCGYFTGLVAGTDKTGAFSALGASRTYAHLGGAPFSYDAWKAAVRRRHTFATCGPLLDFTVNGQPMGSRLALPVAATLAVAWEAASVTRPMTKVELVVNGEVRESQPIAPEGARGQWAVPLDGSAWLALQVRGGYPGAPETVLAHTSPVLVEVAGTELFSAEDAQTILDQIDGCLTYLDTIATRPAPETYARLRAVLAEARERLEARMRLSEP